MTAAKLINHCIRSSFCLSFAADPPSLSHADSSHSGPVSKNEQLNEKHENDIES